MSEDTAKDLIERLNQMGEATTIEAKRGSDVGKSIMETVCAFANEPDLKGGYILLGVEKDTHTLFPFYTVCGISDPEKIKEDLASQCASKFNIAIRPQISEEIVDGKCVLKIFIPEAAPSDKPVYLSATGLPKGAFRRIGASDIRCTDEDLQILYAGRSHQSHDQMPVEGSSMEDLDPEAVELYRTMRARVTASAPELEWNDTDLLQSLHAIVKHPKSKEWVPTIAGIMLFGKGQALRRLFPMVRVDYIRVPGTTWISDPENRFTTVEMRDCLLRLFSRAQATILDDLPKAFNLPEGEMQRKDVPLIPAQVIREALVNALIHRSYREHQPIQILRYANRLEISNPGYSLVSEERFGEPGSHPRNPHIAQVFHDLNLAETKGSGIRTMMALMEKHGLTPPAFLSDRANNIFSTKMLFHHFLGEDDLDWLSKFSDLDLGEGQKKALIFLRETGAINNATYRHLAKIDTLAASKQLIELRSHGLIDKKGDGSATYYEPGSEMVKRTKNAGKKGNDPQLDKNNPQLSPNDPQLTPPADIMNEIKALGARPRIEKTQDIVLKLCAWKDLGAEELTETMGRKDKKMLVKKILQPLLEQNLLARTIPESPNHPYQKYRTMPKTAGKKTKKDKN